MGIRIDPEGLIKGLIEYGEKVEKAKHMYAKQAATMLQREAKKNAPWTDQTGMARKSLNSDVQQLIAGGKKVERIYLAHGVDYGIYLELGNNMNYAILEPTIRLKSNEVLEGLAEMMAKL